MTSDNFFSPSDFDPWADSYDNDVESLHKFPFDGYEQVLDIVVKLAAPQSGMKVLDIGTGTGNLALQFVKPGCELWCSDFSEAMLVKARGKLPQAHFVLHDLRVDWPTELNNIYDRIISAYVFHHFDLQEKVRLCDELVTRRLSSDGRLIIADLSFQNNKEMDDFARSVGELWEAEPYWLADESLPALEKAGMNVKYIKVSGCAGVYSITKRT